MWEAERKQIKCLHLAVAIIPAAAVSCPATLMLLIISVLGHGDLLLMWHEWHDEDIRADLYF